MTGGSAYQWTPDAMDRLERAIVEGDRVRIVRRGGEYIVQPRRVVPGTPADTLVAASSKGEELEFPLDEIEDFDVIL